MNKKTPKIRFSGFTGDWEQRKLKDVSERVRGNDGRMNLPTLTISAGSGWLDQRERFSGNIAGNEQKKYTLLSKGELSYNHGNSKLAKYGVVFALRTFEEALVPRVYHSFQTTDEASADFIEYMFATKKPDRELAKLVSSGARMDGLLNINYDEFIGINIKIPEIDEQNIISNFLRQLDDTIALHLQKLDAIIKIKQGFLQKMFPKDGEVSPEVRFRGFTEDWEQRKLGDVTDYIKGFAFKSKDYRKSGVRIIRVSDLTRDKIKSLNDEIFVSTNLAELNKKYRIKRNEIIITTVGSKAEMKESAVGRPIIVNEKGHYLLNQNLVKISALQGYDNYFIYSQLLQPGYTDYIAMIERGNANQANIAIRDLWGYRFLAPEEVEQRTVGTFFKTIDNTIALHQRELELLKQTKKAFLQKMFV